MAVEIANSTVFTGTFINSDIKTSGGVLIKNTIIDTAAGGFSGNYTALKTDTSLDVIGISVSCIVNLGTTTPSDNGRQLVIKNSTSAATVTISTTVDGAANRRIFPKETIIVMYNGSSWEIQSLFRNAVRSEISSFPHTVTFETHLICSGTGDVTLPLASNVPVDRPIIIKNIGVGIITVYPSSPNTIDTNSSQIINAKQSYTFAPYSSGYILI